MRRTRLPASVEADLARSVVREIQNINKAELSRAGSGRGGSWHDQYKDSAYIFIGGLDSQLTEGDVITIFSQYGEPVDVNLPRDKQTGKSRGFGFLMYEDQKSTILAVDNLNGAKVLNRTLRVDHVSKYKHLEKGDDGKFKEADSERMNALPELFISAFCQDDVPLQACLMLILADKDRNGSDESDADNDDLYEGIDLDDPMAAYLVQQRKEERQLAIANGTYTKRKKPSGSKEERRARKEERRRRREDREARHKHGSRSRANDDDDRRRRDSRSRSRSRSPDRRRR